MYYIQQLKRDDCGFTSLKMLLATINKDKNYLFIKSEEEKHGYSFKDLASIAKKHGATLDGYHIKSLKLAKELTSLPFLLTIKRGEKKHLVLVKYKGAKIYEVNDPSEGKFIYKEKDLEKLMMGTILIISSFKKRKCLEVYPSMIKKRKVLFLCLLKVITFITFALSALFIDKVYSPILPLILLSSGLLMELISRKISLMYFTSLDKEICDHITIKNDKYYEFYQLKQKYKSLLISKIPIYIFSLLLFVFTLYLLIANDIKNMIPLFFTILYIMFYAIFFKDKFKKENMVLELKERQLRNVDNMEDFIKENDEIQKNAYKTGTLFTIVNVFYYFVLIVLLIVNMILNKTILLTYGLFYFFIFVYLKKIIQDISTFPSFIDKEKHYRAQLLSLSEHHNDFENE